MTKLQKFSLLFLLFSLFLSFSAWSLSQTDIIENLQISKQLLQVAEIQLSNLEKELDSKNLLLTQLQTDNQNLKTSLENLQLNFDRQGNLLTEQRTLLTNLSTSNKTLMDTQVQLEEQLTKSLDQLMSLSKASSLKVSLNRWISLSVGIAIGAGITYLIMQYVAGR